jgi:sugar/nucleoside kinase (ribokinase family)
MCDIISPNQTELKRLIPMKEDLETEIHNLMNNNLGMKAIILKQGSSGSTAYTRADGSE